MNNLTLRILAAAVGIPVAVTLIWLGGWWFAGAVMIVSSLALKEFYDLTPSTDASANVPLGLAIGIAFQTSIAYLALEDCDLWFLTLPLSILVVGTLLTLMMEMWRAKPHALFNISATIAGVLYLSVGLSSLIALRAEGGSADPTAFFDHGAALVLTVFVGVWLCDSAAYFAGRWFGRHKLFERVSPKKTWEGAVGGFIAAIGGCVGMAALLLPDLSTVDAVVIGGIIGTLGQIGDLAESWLKRSAKVKDSSSLIPGHGGMLDRFDSMLFVAPSVMLYLMFQRMWS
jgi:phosphatidate cytidylyltransferase